MFYDGFWLYIKLLFFSLLMGFFNHIDHGPCKGWTFRHMLGVHGYRAVKLAWQTCFDTGHVIKVISNDTCHLFLLLRALTFKRLRPVATWRDSKIQTSAYEAYVLTTLRHHRLLYYGKLQGHLFYVIICFSSPLWYPVISTKYFIPLI